MVEEIHNEHGDDRKKRAARSAVGHIWRAIKKRRGKEEVKKLISTFVLSSAVASGVGLGAVGYNQAQDAKDKIAHVQNTPGPTGSPGSNGSNGTNGVDGKNGLDGLVGIPGINGVDGLDGINGKDGSNGASGVNGTNGLNGQDGAPGVQGPQGVPGVQGPAGPSGPQGTQGQQGPQGPAGQDVTDEAQSYIPIGGGAKNVGVGGGATIYYPLGTVNTKASDYLVEVWAVFGQTGNSGSYCSVKLKIDGEFVPNAVVPAGVAYRQNFQVMTLTEGPHQVIMVVSSASNGCGVPAAGFILQRLPTLPNTENEQ